MSTKRKRGKNTSTNDSITPSKKLKQTDELPLSLVDPLLHDTSTDPAGVQTHGVVSDGDAFAAIQAAAQAQAALEKHLNYTSQNGTNGLAHGGHENSQDAAAAISLNSQAPHNGADNNHAAASHETPTKKLGRRNADQSARRKSTNRLLDFGNNSDDEETELAQRILNENDSDGEQSNAEDDQDQDTIRLAPIPEDAETPSRKGRGRPKGARQQRRTPTPPRNLPPCEHYFFQNRSTTKTSNNTIPTSSLLTHEDYFSAMKRYKDPHDHELDFLQNLHERSFHQWAFELELGFSVCLHGWGSKHGLLGKFSEYLHSTSSQTPTIIMIQGYESSLTLRRILSIIASCIPSLTGKKLGAQPTDVLSSIMSALRSSEKQSPIVLVISSIDAAPLRRSAIQAILARIAASPYFHVIASVDNPNFGLLWDASMRSQFNWVFHDSTTFQPFDREIVGVGAGGGVIDEVLELLGRSGRRVQGKEGVSYVLRSLTDSARRLFALLLGEILSLDGEGHEGIDDPSVEAEDAIKDTASKHGPLGSIEHRALYRKAVQQLITGNEINFGQLLKEFYDHQMVTSRRDAAGTEMISVPFRKDECEAILEDLVVDM